jgi:hypothetical protein
MHINIRRASVAAFGALALTLGLAASPASAANVRHPLLNPLYSGYVTPYGHAYWATGLSWHVPSLDCAETPIAQAAQWTGLGGVSGGKHRPSTPLVQIGIISGCAFGIQTEEPFWEVVPSLAAQQLPAADKVDPGDEILASVYYLGDGNYHMAMADTSTSGWTFSMPYSTRVNEVPTTAEWIVESGEAGPVILPLANFGSVAVIGASYSTAAVKGIFLGGPGSVTGVPVAQDLFGLQLANVSTVSSPGEFTVTYVVHHHHGGR